MENTYKAMRTPPFDARFANTNQDKRCWMGFVDYHRCQKLKGKDYEPCNYFKMVYQHMCLASMASKFEEQHEEGNFPANI